MADIRPQLATLLRKNAKDIKNILKTDEIPPRVSIIDVVTAIAQCSPSNAALTFARLKNDYPDVTTNCSDVKFPDARGRKGQRASPVTDARGIVEIIMLLGGRQAARVRRQAAELLVRYLGGDLSLVDEVCRIRGLQEEMAAQAPDNPRRIFGEAVEAAGDPRQLAEFCSDALTRAIPGIIDRLNAHIDQRLEHLSARQRVNLNVRAPKRAAPRPPIARELSPGVQPFPVGRFLDEKEREDPTWKDARRSFAPTFGMQVQVLKKKKLKEEGAQPTYIEQNHRAQLLYTEEDRALMQEAWELTAAHREDIARHPGIPQAAPAVLDRPRRGLSVMDMLQGAQAS